MRYETGALLVVPPFNYLVSGQASKSLTLRLLNQGEKAHSFRGGVNWLDNLLSLLYSIVDGARIST